MATEGREPWTVLKLVNWTAAHFAHHEVDSPRLAAEVLLAHVLKCKRIELYTRFDQQPAEPERSAFRELVRRAAAHEPVAYLVGEKEFYSLPFSVTPEVLIPRSETELLVAEAVGYCRGLGREARVWDACTGSGCVAVSIAHEVPDAAVLATDISESALAVAQGNVERHGLADRIRVRRADLVALPDDCTDLIPFDVITANPPYIVEGAPVGRSVAHEPSLALYGGPEGLDDLERVIRDAPASLGIGGVLILEFGFDQVDEVRDLTLEFEAFDEPRLLRDHAGIERALIATRRE